VDASDEKVGHKAQSGLERPRAALVRYTTGTIATVTNEEALLRLLVALSVLDACRTRAA